MTGVQLTLFKWLTGSGVKSRNGGKRGLSDFVEVYVVRYSIPSEDGKFFVERTLDNKRKIKVRIIPSIIRNKVKRLRFEFYEILKRHNVIKTELGRLVDPVEVPSLRMELEEWKNEFLEIQDLINDFLTNPWKYEDWISIQKDIKRFNIKWPPKNLNIIKDLYVTIEGPISIPKKFYDILITKALTNIVPEEEQ